MPKSRYLAPWHQVDLMEAVKALEEEGQELDAEALEALKGKPAIYHCMSRVVHRQHLLGTPEKEQFVKLMRRYEEFCQVRILTHAIMSNHFHLLLEIPARPPEGGRDWSDERLLRHLECLYSEEQVKEIRWKLKQFRAIGAEAAAEELRESFLRRMWDLSEYMKSLKQCFTRWYNAVHDCRGTLWEERFKSVLVEDGHAARVMAAYIDLNAVRAGIVEDPKDYRWCGYAEAVAGRRRAREGLQRVMYESGREHAGRAGAAVMLSDWKAAVGRYREVLRVTREQDAADKGAGRIAAGERSAGAGREAAVRRSAGAARAVPAAGKGRADQARRLTEAEALRQRVRQFADGLVIGTAGFVNQVFRWTRRRFGPKRKDGARKLRGIETDLRSMRDLSARGHGKTAHP